MEPKPTKRKFISVLYQNEKDNWEVYESIRKRNPHDFLEDIVTFVHSIYSCPNLFPTFNITSPNSPSLSHSPISSSCLPGHSHIPLSEQPGACERLQLSPGLLRGDKIIKRRGSAVSTQDHWETQLNFTFFLKNLFKLPEDRGPTVLLCPHSRGQPTVQDFL